MELATWTASLAMAFSGGYYRTRGGQWGRHEAPANEHAPACTEEYEPIHLLYLRAFGTRFPPLKDAEDLLRRLGIGPMIERIRQARVLREEERVKAFRAAQKQPRELTNVERIARNQFPV